MKANVNLNFKKNAKKLVSELADIWHPCRVAYYTKTGIKRKSPVDYGWTGQIELVPNQAKLIIKSLEHSLKLLATDGIGNLKEIKLIKEIINSMEIISLVEEATQAIEGSKVKYNVKLTSSHGGLIMATFIHSARELLEIDGHEKMEAIKEISQTIGKAPVRYTHSAKEMRY